MEFNNKLALIVAYYLSKFDTFAVEKLGYKNSTQAFNGIGTKLSIKANTIKNMRDEFDSIHDNLRQGWYQRPLRPSRLKVIEVFQHLTEEELYEIIVEIIDNKEFKDSNECLEMIRPIADNEKKRILKKREFILRGHTGKKAEEIFIEYFKQHKFPMDGVLVDTREMGCGYDFEIVKGELKIFIEVKGLNGTTGGILFTNKEWQLAKQKMDKYYLVLVHNVSGESEVNIIQNPIKKINAKKNIFTSVQVNWTVSHSDLNSLFKL